MQINTINFDNMDYETIKAMELDNRINYFDDFEVAFVLTQDCEAIKETYGARIDNGDSLFVESSSLQVENNFDTLDIFRINLSSMDEKPELFNNDFPAWLDRIQRVFNENIC